MPNVYGPAPPLSAPGVHLSPPTPADVPAIFAACTEPEAVEFLNVPQPYQLSDAEAYVRGASAGDGGLFWGIREHEGGALVGMIALKFPPRDAGDAPKSGPDATVAASGVGTDGAAASTMDANPSTSTNADMNGQHDATTTTTTTTTAHRDEKGHAKPGAAAGPGTDAAQQRRTRIPDGMLGGMCLLASDRGKGLATRAAAAVIQHAFSRGCRCLMWESIAANGASVALGARLGFAFGETGFSESVYAHQRGRPVVFGYIQK